MKRYFKLCLLSPLWLPAVVGLIALVTEGLLGGAEHILPQWLVFTGAIIGVSIFFGGIQYAIALYIVWTRIDFERTQSWIVGVLWLPIIFTILQMLGMVLVFFRELDNLADLKFVLWLGGFDLALGYGYVAVWFVGLGVIQVFKKRRQEACT